MPDSIAEDFSTRELAGRARGRAKEGCPCRYRLAGMRILPEGIHSHLRIVLVRPRNPLNIGAAARAMSNFGFTRLRVVNPYEVAFREARSAVGASEVLASAEEFTSIADAVADCGLVVGTTALGHREIQHPPEAAGRSGGNHQLSKQPSRPAFWLGENWALQPRFQPLPLAAAYSQF